MQRLLQKRVNTPGSSSTVEWGLDGNLRGKAQDIPGIHPSPRDIPSPQGLTHSTTLAEEGRRIFALNREIDESLFSASVPAIGSNSIGKDLFTYGIPNHVSPSSLLPVSEGCVNVVGTSMTSELDFVKIDPQEIRNLVELRIKPPPQPATCQGRGRRKRLSHSTITSTVHAHTSKTLQCQLIVSGIFIGEAVEVSAQANQAEIIDINMSEEHQNFVEGSLILLEIDDYLGKGSLGVVEMVRSTSPEFKDFARKRIEMKFHQRKAFLRIAQKEAEILRNL